SVTIHAGIGADTRRGGGPGRAACARARKCTVMLTKVVRSRVNLPQVAGSTVGFRPKGHVCRADRTRNRHRASRCGCPELQEHLVRRRDPSRAALSLATEAW